MIKKLDMIDNKTKEDRKMIDDRIRAAFAACSAYHHRSLEGCSDTECLRAAVEQMGDYSPVVMIRPQILVTLAAVDLAAMSAKCSREDVLTYIGQILAELKPDDLLPGPDSPPEPR